MTADDKLWLIMGALDKLCLENPHGVQAWQVSRALEYALDRQYVYKRLWDLERKKLVRSRKGLRRGEHMDATYWLPLGD